MSNTSFVPSYSTDDICVGQDTTKCLTDELEEIKNSIPEEDTNEYALASHNHDGVYAAAEHTHTGYAAATHEHVDYAAANHEHAGYAATEHEHAGYAASNHVHNEYAAAAITAHMANEYYPAPAGGEYITIPLTTDVLVGTGFTRENNKIRVGSGISKVKVSAQLCVGSSNLTNKYLAIRKNTTTQLARAQKRLHENTTPETMAIASLVTDVTEGDLISLDFYGEENDTLYGGYSLTYITVEKMA